MMPWIAATVPEALRDPAIAQFRMDVACNPDAAFGAFAKCQSVMKTKSKGR